MNLSCFEIKGNAYIHALGSPFPIIILEVYHIHFLSGCWSVFSLPSRSLHILFSDPFLLIPKCVPDPPLMGPLPWATKPFSTLTSDSLQGYVYAVIVCICCWWDLVTLLALLKVGVKFQNNKSLVFKTQILYLVRHGLKYRKYDSRFYSWSKNYKGWNTECSWFARCGVSMCV